MSNINLGSQYPTLDVYLPVFAPTKVGESIVTNAAYQVAETWMLLKSSWDAQK